MVFNDKQSAIDYLNELSGLIEVKPYKGERSSQQNRALHLFFRMVADQLNELGLEFHYSGLKGLELTTRYTEDIVKNFVWRPIQIAMFDKESTRKINHEEINEILDVITKFFGDRGVPVYFPNRFDQYLEFVK